MHLYNHVEPRPAQDIIALWTRACELNDRDGCRNMGVMRRDGSLVPRNQALAVSFFQKACQLGFEPACREPGVQTP
jgi:TPR repeat protein